jgi:aspartate 1-decarboxylase
MKIDTIVLNMREFLCAKIHKATVTQAELDYIGSITIDESLMEKSGLLAGQKVLVVSNTSGCRLETYVLKGIKGSGTICMNGACALQIKKGEEIIIMGFEFSDKEIEAKSILVDKDNMFIRYL